MTCKTVGGMFICGPPRGVYRRINRDCPECQRVDARWIERWDGAWYGTTLFCECGDWWMDGLRMTRPFARYWRRDAQARFEAMWTHAAGAELYEAYAKADMDLAAMDGDLEDAADRRAAAHAAILAAQDGAE